VQKSKKKICVVVTGLSGGGAEMMLFQLFTKLDKDLYSVSVVSLTSLGVFGPRFTAAGIQVIALGISGFSSGLKAAFVLGRILKKEKPHIVQTWMYHADLIAGFVAKFCGMMHVVWGVRANNPSSEHHSARTRLVIRLCALASGWIPCRIVFCSENSRERHASGGYVNSSSLVIPNGFESSTFPEPSMHRRLHCLDQLGLATTKRIVGFVGRDHSVKNLPGFIEMAAKVRERCSNTHFVMIGERIDHSNIEIARLLRQYNLSDSFTLLGRREDAIELMAMMDVLVLTSFSESFPNVLAEAMLCGVPCVSTDVGDASLILGDIGCVARNNDAGTLSGHVIDLLALNVEERQELGRKARERIARNFDITQIAKRYEALYATLHC
jgi:glycosyltransferase involved in cell wall biosynthesis